MGGGIPCRVGVIGREGALIYESIKDGHPSCASLLFNPLPPFATPNILFLSNKFHPCEGIFALFPVEKKGERFFGSEENTRRS